MAYKILIINPNSDLDGTDAIAKSANNFAGSDFLVTTISMKSAPKFIATYKDQFLAAAELVDTVTQNQDKYDAFIIACHADPNLDLLKECSNKPVIGIAEASMKIASMLGHKFSIIAPGERGVPNKEMLIRKYGLQDQLASIRPLTLEKGVTEQERLLAAGHRALNEDHAEVLVLGCAEFTGFDIEMERVLGVPVLDGVICALIIAIGLVKYGKTTSKARRYMS